MQTATIHPLPVQEYLPNVHEDLHPAVLLKTCRLRLGLTPRQAAQWLMDFNVPAEGQIAELLWVQMENGTTVIPAAIWARLRTAEQFRLDLETHLSKTLGAWFTRESRAYLMLTYLSAEDYIISDTDAPEHWMITEVALARMQERYPKLLLVPFDPDDYSLFRGEQEDSRALRMEWCRGHTEDLARFYQACFFGTPPEPVETDPLYANQHV
jgi:hypothetical protein